MKKQIILLAIFSFQFALYHLGFAQKEVPFTLDDRDRIIRMDEKLNSQQKEIASLRNEINTRFESIHKEMNTRFDYQQQQINDLKNLFYWGFGMLITIMLFIFGFIIWDRRTFAEPLRERSQELLQSLREYAKEQPKLADILRSHGLM